MEALLHRDSEPWKLLTLEAVVEAGWPRSFSLAHTHPHIASRQKSPAQEGSGRRLITGPRRMASCLCFFPGAGKGESTVAKAKGRPG